MKYSIRIVTAEEYAKADADPDYAPAEVEIDTVICEEWKIAGIVNRRLFTGIYPRGVQYVEEDGSL